MHTREETVDLASRAPAGTQDANSASRAQLSRADWIATATDVLISKGVDSIKVDLLARKLGVTKGSFYWHFVNRSDLLKQVLLQWRETQTELLIVRYRLQGSGPDDLVRQFAELPFRGRSAARGAAIELAIRAWARRDEMARSVVDEVDAMRLAHLSEPFRSLGCGEADARCKAFLLYCYMQSEALFYRQGSDAEKRERRQFVVQLLLAPTG